MSKTILKNIHVYTVDKHYKAKVDTEIHDGSIHLPFDVIMKLVDTVFENDSCCSCEKESENEERQAKN